MKHKKITLMALAMSIVLTLSACGSVADNTNADSVETTESIEETVESTESTESEETEAFVSEEELNTEETAESETDKNETVETISETTEPLADQNEIEVKTVAAYTYTDLNKTMYAKSTVNVRSLPSTDGDKLGSLSKNQEVTVTGQCNETGWYRIKFNGGDACVSNKYLSDEPAATAQASTGKTKNTSTANASTQSTGDPIADAAIAKFGPNAVVFADGTIFDATTWQQVGTVDDLNGVDNNTATATDGYDRAAAEQVWSLMNAERTSAGLNALAWDENMYNYACARAHDIVTDFSHNGCFSGYGENIWFGSGCGNDAGSRAHNGWYNSPGHHANYMDTIYGSGACAVYVYNGNTYAVENFAPATNPYATNQYRESNGETLDLSGQQAEAFDNGNTWTASNGIVVYIQSNGNLSTNGNSQADIDACLEYYATHGY